MAACNVAAVVPSAGKNDSMANSDRVTSTGVQKIVVVLTNDSTPASVRKRSGTSTPPKSLGASCCAAPSSVPSPRFPRMAFTRQITDVIRVQASQRQFNRGSGMPIVVRPSQDRKRQKADGSGDATPCLMINGERGWLWRAVHDAGEVLDILAPNG